VSIYWGELHGHTDLSPCYSRDFGGGAGTFEQVYGYARDVAGLDFVACADHDYPLRAGDWAAARDAAARFHAPGRFVTVPAYEWTSEHYGHRNVLFGCADDAPAPLVACSTTGRPGGASDRTPADLWRDLRAWGRSSPPCPGCGTWPASAPSAGCASSRR
jgi:hypothetical protein